MAPHPTLVGARFGVRGSFCTENDHKMYTPMEFCRIHANLRIVLRSTHPWVNQILRSFLYITVPNSIRNLEVLLLTIKSGGPPRLCATDYFIINPWVDLTMVLWDCFRTPLQQRPSWFVTKEWCLVSQAWWSGLSNKNSAKDHSIMFIPDHAILAWYTCCKTPETVRCAYCSSLRWKFLETVWEPGQG